MGEALNSPGIAIAVDGEPLSTAAIIDLYLNADHSHKDIDKIDRIESFPRPVCFAKSSSGRCCDWGKVSGSGATWWRPCWKRRRCFRTLRD
jgi:hypothetical protein